MKSRILIVDDDIDVCILLQNYLNRNNFNTQIAGSARKAFEALRKQSFEVVFCDFRLGDKDGSDVLAEIKNRYPETAVIIMTAYSDIKLAVQMIKAGAFDYLSKPLIPEELLNITHKALDHIKQKEQQVTPSSGQTPDAASRYPQKETFFKGHSPAMKKLYEKIDVVAPTNYSIILQGESGSGKEALAKSIHQKSLRSSGPFIALDCGTLSRELSNSELFGHIKGSFTGAINDKKGHFEMANGGTLFLDEIANLSYDIQAALLRVIQERKVKRIGSTKELNLDVRIIAASHEDLKKAHEKKIFREDLYHRLNEFSIAIPPLRERKEDIPGFAEFFLNHSNKETGKDIMGFDEEVMQLFLHYSWPGNIRELRNVIRKAVLLTSSGNIKQESLSSDLLNDAINPKPQKSDPSKGEPQNADLKKAGMEGEYRAIVEALKTANFNKSKAAKLLNIDRKTLYNKLKEYKE